jgi:hypothetical protein
MSLLLLVHLYILHHPSVNGPEYDHNLFNPRVRGLRHRTKAMQDIAYFLVAQIEREVASNIVSSLSFCVIVLAL